jgi:hypothetical protein
MKTKTYSTNSGLGYQEYAILLLLGETKGQYKCLCLETNHIGDMYTVGKIVYMDLYELEVEIEYDIETSPLYNNLTRVLLGKTPIEI